MRVKNLTLYILIICLLFSSQAFADSWVPRVTYEGIRPLGMGGAFVAVADDKNAMYYNPAGMEQIGNPHVSIFNFSVDWNEDTDTLLDQVDKIQDLTGTMTNAQKLTKVSEILTDTLGLKTKVRFNFMPYWIKKGFGTAILVQGDIEAGVLDKVSPRLEIAGNVDGVAIMSKALHPTRINFAGKRVKIIHGFSGKIVGRAQVINKKDNTNNVTLNAIDLADDDFDFDDYVDTKTGYGLGFDYGVLLRYDHVNHLTVGMCISDILNTKLSDDIGTIKRSVRIGAAIKPQKNLLLACDIDDALNTGKNFLKKLHMGGEMKLANSMKFRAGFYQGYPTFGFTFKALLMEIEYANYQKELGSRVGLMEEKRQSVNIHFMF